MFVTHVHWGSTPVWFVLIGVATCGGAPGCVNSKLVAEIDAVVPTDDDPLPMCPTLECEAPAVITQEGSLEPFEGCTHIVGSLALVGYAGESLASLSCLQSVGGSFFIESASELIDLEGLENLRTVAGSLVIGHPFLGGNDILESIDALGNLELVGGSFVVDSNPSLLRIGGVSRLKEVGGSFDVYANPLLTSIEAFVSLEAVGGNFVVERNPFLERIADMTSLTVVDGSLSILDNDRLVSVGHWLSLEMVRGDFVVSSDDRLPSLMGFETLKEVKGDVHVEDNDLLSDLVGFDGLETVGGSLFIGSYQNGGNRSLIKLDGLERLVKVAGWLVINSNPFLGSVKGLSSLRTVGQSLQICGNYALANLDGFEQLTEVAGDVWIGCDKIVSYGLVGIGGLTALSRIGGTLYVLNNANLQSVDGLIGLRTASYIIVSDNDELLTVRGLRHLQRLGLASVFIISNRSLPQCDPLKLRDILVAQGFFLGDFIAVNNNGKGPCTEWPDY